MNEDRHKEVMASIEASVRAGLTRREICRAAEIHHATLYRWLDTWPAFRRWFLALEQQHAEDRSRHKWFTHPFRGKRPPRAEAGRDMFPCPRYSVVNRKHGVASVRRNH